MRRRKNKELKSKDLVLEDVDQELFIEEEYINEELRDQPLKFRKWVKIEAKCKRKVTAIEQSLDLAEAQAYMAAKAELEKPTIKDLESEVKMDEEVVRLKTELLEAQHELDDVKGIVRAFAQRHELLKDIAANIRKEVLD